MSSQKQKTSWLNSSRDRLKYSARDGVGSSLGEYLLRVKGVSFSHRHLPSQF